MNDPARLAAAIELLGEIAEAGRPADAVVSAFFRARRYIGSKDRAAIGETVFAVLRARARLLWHLERASKAPAPRALMIAFLVLARGEGARLRSLFTGERFAPARLDPSEEIFVEHLGHGPLAPPDMPEAVRLEVPPWAEDGLRAAFGPDFPAEAAALLEPAPLDLRVNPLKTDREGAIAALAAAGIRARPGRWSP
ncbi:MAG: rRNA cytosine-C5-methylase, partial [Alphaproteobacteria bacterium]|nr:rRNA cytosine-C5-methylase [Alphaproteobacteria bacterium]